MPWRDAPLCKAFAIRHIPTITSEALRISPGFQLRPCLLLRIARAPAAFVPAFQCLRHPPNAPRPQSHAVRASHILPRPENWKLAFQSLALSELSAEHWMNSWSIAPIPRSVFASWNFIALIVSGWRSILGGQTRPQSNTMIRISERTTFPIPRTMQLTGRKSLRAWISHSRTILTPQNTTTLCGRD
jgi:hypothetical protein